MDTLQIPLTALPTTKLPPEFSFNQLLFAETIHIIVLQYTHRHSSVQGSESGMLPHHDQRRVGFLGQASLPLT